MSERAMSIRAAAVAGGGLLGWALVLGGRVPLGAWFLLTVLMSTPFLAFGARVEGDGELSSPRRRWTLAAIVALALLQALTWDASIFLGAALSPLVAVVAWFAAGPAPARRSKTAT